VSVRVSVHQPVPDRTPAVWLDSAADLSSANSTQAYWVDGDHQPTDLAVGGSNPSRRAKRSSEAIRQGEFGRVLQRQSLSAKAAIHCDPGRRVLRPRVTNAGTEARTE
jgi:hypothetical protein